MDAGAPNAPFSFEECNAHVPDIVSLSCEKCLCSDGMVCRQLLAQNPCDAQCWSLVQCIISSCPDFSMMSGAGDIQCVTSACSAFLSGASQATALGPCINPCIDACQP